MHYKNKTKEKKITQMVKSQMCAVTEISYQLLSSSLPCAINLDMYIKS